MDGVAADHTQFWNQTLMVTPGTTTSPTPASHQASSQHWASASSFPALEKLHGACWVAELSNQYRTGAEGFGSHSAQYQATSSSDCP